MKGQENSLEYKTYQDLVRAELLKHGYQETLPEKADVVIAFSYGIDSGQTILSSSHTSGTINSGASTPISGKLNLLGFGDGGVEADTKHTYTTIYNRVFQFYIVNKKTVGTEKLEVLYEASVKSAGSASHLTKVMPGMVKALFKEFPGKSGATRKEMVLIQ